MKRFLIADLTLTPQKKNGIVCAHEKRIQVPNLRKAGFSLPLRAQKQRSSFLLKSLRWISQASRLRFKLPTLQQIILQAIRGTRHW